MFRIRALSLYGLGFDSFLMSS